MISLLRGSECIVAKPLAIGNAEISLARLVYKNQSINIMIIYSVSGFFIILKVFINYKKFAFAAAFFFSLFKSRIVTVLALRNAAAFSSTLTAFFTPIVNIAFAALIAQLSPLRIAPAVIPSFRIGLFLSPPPLPPNTLTAVTYSLYSRFNFPKLVFIFT